jgi:hypothetical protein
MLLTASRSGNMKTKISNAKEVLEIKINSYYYKIVYLQQSWESHLTIIGRMITKTTTTANQQYPSRLFRLAFDGVKNGTSEVRSL